MNPGFKRWLIVAIVGALLLWVGIDLYGPLRVDIRGFDPREVAHLDTVMWRSYYDRKPLLLFFQMGKMMRTQFHFPFLRSYVAAERAARAAFVFKDGHSRADYERALPELLRYFAAIHKVSVTPFDVHRASELELEWWIVHRQRAQHGDGDLPLALAEAGAELYQVPKEKLMEYGRLRTDAMTIRDTKAAAGGVTEDDWQKIESDLQGSWQSLWKAIQP